MARLSVESQRVVTIRSKGYSVIKIYQGLKDEIIAGNQPPNEFPSMYAVQYTHVQCSIRKCPSMRAAAVHIHKCPGVRAVRTGTLACMHQVHYTQVPLG